MPCNNAIDYPCGLEERLVDNYNCIIKLGKRVSELEKVVMECVVRIEAQDRAWEKAVRKLNGEPYVEEDGCQCNECIGYEMDRRKEAEG